MLYFSIAKFQHVVSKRSTRTDFLTKYSGEDVFLSSSRSGKNLPPKKNMVVKV